MAAPMTTFEKLALRGLWLILKQLMRNPLDYDEVAWFQEVSKATGDNKLSASNFASMIR